MVRLKFEWSLRHKKHLLFKIVVPFLLMGIAYRIFSDVVSNPIQSYSEKTHIAIAIPPTQSNFSDIVDVAELPLFSDVKCDLFTGEWIPNPFGPEYTNETCSFIEMHQNCMKNGRPDSAYLYWRWKPYDCELARFNPLKFLHLMRNKSWALIGDSITRNHVQSILCMISKVEQVIEIYHDDEYKFRTWFVTSYNFTISVIWSPFLVQADIFEDMNGVSTSPVQLHIDKLDTKWINMYQNLDYLIISTGKWFQKPSIIYENNTFIGCHKCTENNFTELGMEFTYRKVLKTVLEFVVKGHKGNMVIFRTSTPDHFENGEWNNGGSCEKKEPVIKNSIEFKEVSRVLRGVELSEFSKVMLAASENGSVNLKLIDVAGLSLLRPDGHPGAYRHFHPFAEGRNGSSVQNDCLHWCLPGPIDAWNDVLFEMVMNG